MLRNLRVQRQLEEWRQEGNSYISVIPRDILTLILPYVAPDVWNDLFITEELWRCDIKGMVHYFLADHSLLIYAGGTSFHHITKSGHRSKITLVSLCNFPILFPDHRGGFWYMATQSENETQLAYYDPFQQAITETRCLPIETRGTKGRFVFTTDGSCYLYLGGEIAKFSPEGHRGPSYTSVHSIVHLGIVEDRLYYQLRCGRFYLLPPLQHESLDISQVQLKEKWYRYCFRSFNGFAVTDSDAYALAIQVICLLVGKTCFLVPTPGRHSLCLTITAAGEILLLTEESDQEYRLYRIY